MGESTLEKINFFVGLVSNSFTIGASLWAIILYFRNKDAIKRTFSLLLNYSYQITLTDLRYKVERLNDYNVVIPEQHTEAINLLHEIEGHISGSEFLKKQLAVQLKKINYYTKDTTRFKETSKRSLVSYLKTSIQDVDVSNFKNSVQ